MRPVFFGGKIRFGYSLALFSIAAQEKGELETFALDSCLINCHLFDIPRGVTMTKTTDGLIYIEDEEQEGRLGGRTGMQIDTFRVCTPSRS